jgi:hypothetical protein
MTNGSKDRGKTKCSLWSSKFWVRRGANDLTPEKFTVTRPRETKILDNAWCTKMEEPHRAVAPVKNNSNNNSKNNNSDYYYYNYLYEESEYICLIFIYFPTVAPISTKFGMLVGDMHDVMS